MNSSTAEIAAVKAQNIVVSDEALTVDLEDGRTISVPLGWYPRLVDGTSEERSHWKLLANGAGIHWADLDEDISVHNLLSGQPSAESQSSLKKWLEQRAANRQAS